MHFENQTEHTFGAGIDKLAELDFTKADSTSTFIAAAEGSKSFIPEFVGKACPLSCCMYTDSGSRAQDFFNAVILTTPKAHTWVTSRVSVGRAMKRLKDVMLQVPVVWMLTGVYFLDDAISWSTHGRQNQKGAEVNMPIPDPAGFAELLQLKAKAQYTTKSGRVFEHGMQIADRKVWAASFQRLNVEYMYFRQGMKVLPNQISLLNVFSAARGDEDAAQIKVLGEFDATDDFGKKNIDSAFDDQYWSVFLDKAEKIEARAGKARENAAKRGN